YPDDLKKEPPMDIQEMYTKWINNDASGQELINFSEVFAPFLTLFLSFTNESDDEVSSVVFEQDKKEDTVAEELV
ncbi:hypothetical protein MBANPS3_005016, partial [Mucor bainieri]